MPNADRRPRRLQAQPSLSSRLALHESARPMIARALAELPRDFTTEALTAAYDAWIEGTAAATIRDGIATIPVRNVLTKDWSWWNYWLGWSSYEEIAYTLEVVLAQPDVRGVILAVDSPGGMVDGCAELGERVLAARASGIPIVAHVDGMAASAAYWIASAASRVVLAPTAMVGSIGVVMSFTDWSKYEESLGVRTIEIVSTQSPNKRPNPADEAGRAQLQTHVDAMAAVFVEAVARQRGVSADVVAREFGQGDVFVGQAALGAGLADALGTYDATHRALVEETASIAVQVPVALGRGADPTLLAAHVAAAISRQIPSRTTAATAAAFPHQEDAMAVSKPANRPAAADVPVEEDDEETPTPEGEETSPVEDDEDEESDASEDEEEKEDEEEEEEKDEEEKKDEEDEEAKALAKQSPQIVARIRARAAAAERRRIAGISALGRPGQETIVRACIKDARCTVAQAALRVLKHEQSQRAAHLRGVRAEEEGLEKPDNKAAPSATGDAAVVGSIVALLNDNNARRLPAAGRK